MEREEILTCIEKQKAECAFWDYKERIKALKKLYKNILLMKDDIFDNVPETDKIHEVDLKERMEAFYIDYAMSVIVARAFRMCGTG